MKRYFPIIPKTIENSKKVQISGACEPPQLLSNQQEIQNVASSSRCFELNDCESDSSEDSHTRNKKIYGQNYKSEWEAGFPWLKKVDGKAFCTQCFTVLVNNKSHLSRHEKTKLHLKNTELKRSTQTLENCCHNSPRLTERQKKKEAEFICVMYCIQYDLPFTQMDSIPMLLRLACKDSDISRQIKCGRTKAIEMVNKIIGPFSKQLLADKLKNTEFSLIIDETTDVSSAKCLVIIARFFDEIKCTVSDNFLGLVELVDSTAQNIFNTIQQQLEDSQIPIKNIISLAVDNASVMTGQANGVISKFQNINPNLFLLRCTCHSLHLCASAATKQLPSNIEKTVKNIYNHFAHSPKRIGAYKKFQEYFNLQNHKLLGLSTTRWLSYEMVINRILEQWEALKHYFGLHDFEELQSSNAGDIYDFLVNPINKLYLLFLSYILKLLNDANKIFQSESTKIHILYSKMKELYLDILKNYIKLEFLDIDVDFTNHSLHLPTSTMHFGIHFDLFLKSQRQHIGQEDIQSLKQSLILFYIELNSQLKKRFNFNNSKLELLKYLHINQIVSGGLSTIMPLLKVFPYSKCEEEVLNNQFRRLIGNIDISRKYMQDDVVKFWVNLKLHKTVFDDQEYQELCTYMLKLCALPHSTAAAERKFSRLNLIKTTLRNSLNISTVENLMNAKELLNLKKTCWEPSDSDGLMKFADNFALVDGEYQSKI